MKGDAVRMLKHHFANAIKAITGEGVPGSTTKRKGGGMSLFFPLPPLSVAPVPIFSSRIPDAAE